MLWVLASVWEAALKALCSLQAQERGNAPAVCPPAHSFPAGSVVVPQCHSCPSPAHSPP